MKFDGAFVVFIFQRIIVQGLPCMLAAMCLVANKSSTQTISFTKRYDLAIQDEATSVRQTLDGGYIMAGTLENNFFQIFGFLLKADAFGGRTWAKSYAGTMANAVIQLEDTGYVFVGGTAYSPLGPAFIVRTNSRGDTLWRKAAFPGEGNALIRTRDSGLVIVGTRRVASFSISDVQLAKMNLAGDVLWTRSFDIATRDFGFDVRETSDGGLIVLGSALRSASDSADALLMRTNANGDSLWTRKFSGPQSNSNFSLEVTNDGGFLFVTDTTVQASPEKKNVYLVRTDSLGVVLWTKSYGHSVTSQQGRSVHRDLSGEYVVAGSIADPLQENEKVWLLRVTAQGDTVWTRTFKIDSSTVPTSVRETTDGGFVLAGWTRTFVDSLGYDDSFLIKTDIDGVVSVRESPLPIPTDFQLFQNYPNPFNPATTITYGTGKLGFVSLTVSDVLGRQVAALVNGVMPVGMHSVTFGASGLASGVYFYSLRVEGFVSVNKMVLIK